MFRFPGDSFVRRGLLVLLAIGAALVAIPVAAGQMELAVIQGTVKDEAGKPLEGVTFRLKDIGRGSETTIKSDKNGKFYRRGLQAVEYELVVEKDGYQAITDKVRLSAGENSRRFDFKLAKAAPEGAGDFAKGVEAYNKGDHAAAAAAFEAAMAKAPDLPEIRVNLALAYFKLQRSADAVAQLEKAASLAPNNQAVQFQLGGAYVEMQSLDKAMPAFEKGLSIKIGPERPAGVGSARDARRGLFRERRCR
jgi:tetratricopeptide (TPR) repeat protein